MTTNRKQKIRQLKEACKYHAAEGVGYRKLINKTTGMERYHMWDEKRDVGETARIHYIAYCLLRGRDYAKMESIVNDHGDTYAVTIRIRQVVATIQLYCIEVERDFWTKEHVGTILRTGNGEV